MKTPPGRNKKFGKFGAKPTVAKPGKPVPMGKSKPGKSKPAGKEAAAMAPGLINTQASQF
jgi:hypothetical protein